MSNGLTFIQAAFASPELRLIGVVCYLAYLVPRAFGRRQRFASWHMFVTFSQARFHLDVPNPDGSRREPILGITCRTPR